MPDIWMYHPDVPQGRIVDTALVGILTGEGWVHTPRLLPPGSFFGEDGTGNKIPLMDDGEDAPPVVAVASPPPVLADPNPEEEPAGTDEDGKFAGMKKAELLAYALNNFGKTIPVVTRRADIIAKIKELES